MKYGWVFSPGFGLEIESAIIVLESGLKISPIALSMRVWYSRISLFVPSSDSLGESTDIVSSIFMYARLWGYPEVVTRISLGVARLRTAAPCLHTLAHAFGMSHNATDEIHQTVKQNIKLMPL